MNEKFLHFVWKNQLYDDTSLITANGLPLEILNPGTYNTDSGPDFLNARVKIGSTEWAGNIEIHLNSSMWYQHKHHLDPAYNNVILHVVVSFDREVRSLEGAELETLIIRPEANVLKRFRDYMNVKSGILCREDLDRIDLYFVRHWINKLAVARVEDKTLEIADILNKTNSDWEETLYIVLSSGFGLKVNSQAFRELAVRLPLKLIRKHADNPLQVEALLFGQAGMLDRGILPGMSGDEYFGSAHDGHLAGLMATACRNRVIIGRHDAIERKKR